MIRSLNSGKGGYGRAHLFDSEAAKSVRAKKRPCSPAHSPEEVLEAAKEAVLGLAGDPENQKHVLGQHRLVWEVSGGNISVGG